MCGIIGVSGIPDAARLTYLGLYALQHRGQESAGIVAIDRDGHGPLAPRHGAGERELRRDDPGHAAGRRRRGPHPLLDHRQHGARQRAALQRQLPAAGRWPSPTTATSSTPPRSSASWSSRAPSSPPRRDTEVLVHLIARSEADTVEGQIRDALEQVDGAYSLVITRRPHAVRRGRQPRLPAAGAWAGSASGMVVASETCALDLLGATSTCELQPGEFVRIEDGQVTELPRLAPRPVSRCVFELVYFARPDSTRLRRVGGPGPPRAGPAARPGAAGARRRGGLQRARQLQRHGAGLLRGLRHQARVRPDPEPLRRPDLHQPDPGPPGGQGQDQVQPGARRHPGQVGGGGGRQPGPRQHQQEPGADDPRRRRARGAPPARLAADHRAVPLRHRHADPGGAHRRHPLDRGDPRSSSASIRWATSRSTACCARPARTPASATPASRASTRRRSRTTWCSSGTPPRWWRRPA